MVTPSVGSVVLVRFPFSDLSASNWYYSEEFQAEGWLCPALLKYFQKPPKTLYIKAAPIEETETPNQ